MRRFWLGFLMMVTAGGVAQAATTPLYINTAPLSTTKPPQIDATAFENRSLFEVVLGGGFSFFGNFGGSSRAINFGTTRPYETFNTLYFTNTGSGYVYADPGYFWDHSYAGGRGRMGSWINRGTVAASGWMWVDATNIVSTGPGISVGPHGVVHLSGDSVNVSRSVLQLSSSSAAANGAGSGVLIDQWWGVSSNNYTLGGSFLGLTVPDTFTPTFSSQSGGGFGGFGGGNSLPSSFLSQGNYDAFAYTNALSPTVNIISVVFVPTNAIQWGVGVNVGWTDTGGGSLIARVQFNAGDVDLLTGTPFTNYVTLVDTLPFRAATNIFLLRDGGGFFGSVPLGYIPNNFNLFADTSGGSVGSPTNAPFDPNYFVSSEYLSNTVAAAYTVFSARLSLTDNPYEATTTRPYSPPGWSGLPIQDLSNYVGRIEIDAKKLNLDLVRMRAETSVILKTDNLVGNKAPIIDAPYLSFDFKSTQPQLVVSNMIAPSVNRFIGDVSAWSSIWLNFTTNATTGETNYFFTHALVLDHTLSLTQSVTLADFKLRATNVVIADSFDIGRNFLVESKSLVNSGTINNLSGGDLAGTNLVGIINFTNSGSLLTGHNLNLGQDRSTPYSNIVNYGTISAAAVQIKTRNLINTNLITVTSGSFESYADSTRFVGSSSIQGASDVLLAGSDLYASNSVISAGSALSGAGALVFDWDGTVSDAGLVSSNLWTAYNGFAISAVPKGNLLGTTIQSVARTYQEATHYSDADDMGVGSDGYADNFAIGRLVLDGGTNSFFRFSPSPGGTNKAFYVDYLELVNFATNYTDYITVDEGCTVYFANANIDPTKLNHISGDRFRWVSTYSGPRSTTNVVYSAGVTNTLNRALVTSADIDSDNDGVANVNDSTPVWTSADINLTIALTNVTPRIQVPFLSWTTLRSFDSGGFQNYVTNTVQYIPNAGSTDWKTLTNFVSALGSSQTNRVGFVDRLGTNRLYRVQVHVQDP